MAYDSPDELQACIDDCLRCYRVCLETATRHCLKLGGAHVEQNHLRLMFDCAEVCRSAAHLMISGSEFHPALCAACAPICHACAQSCAQLGDMRNCVEACRACATSCSRMAQAESV